MLGFGSGGGGDGEGDPGEAALPLHYQMWF